MIHACFNTICYMFCLHLIAFLCIFGTNILTRCPVPVPVFCCFSVSEKYLRKYSRNRTGQKPRTLGVRQKPGETLRKHLRRFSQVRNKIHNATDAQVISAFQAGVTDVRMLEKLGIHDNITSVVKLFDLADK